MVHVRNITEEQWRDIYKGRKHCYLVKKSADVRQCDYIAFNALSPKTGKPNGRTLLVEVDFIEYDAPGIKPKYALVHFKATSIKSADDFYSWWDGLTSRDKEEREF